MLAVCLICLPWARAESSALVVTGGVFDYSAQAGDSLIKIGARFGAAPEVLARENALQASVHLVPSQKITIDNRHIVPAVLENGLLINLPQRMLYLFRETQLVAAYPVGLGKPSWPTPMGEFSVIHKSANKTWIVPLSIQAEMRRMGQKVKTMVPPGPDNPLGKYWLGLSLDSIGIHGTIAPTSIYHFQSHGCIRLHPEDIEALFEQIPRGATGHIIYSPLLMTESSGRIFLEVHRDSYNRGGVSMAALEQLARQESLTDRIDWAHAAEVLKLKDGIARDVTLSSGLH
ncbi:L,D-transpeptidase family protein [Rugosibacter aromaticivorans]|uniref:L,D-transpeptidase family protein n=1 Tax=Rugosibacter aromaticivorans TaxID=1565605 RepID=UPI00192A2C4A|nr:L,D-transpeptidase family protein [Rugosibacter aromaticivorans]